jgi:hypothetical protein
VLLALLAGLIVVLLLAALVVYLLRGRIDGTPREDEQDVTGLYYGEATPPGPHPTSDFIGEEEGDLVPDPEAEAEAWQREREIFREKNEPTQPPG